MISSRCVVLAAVAITGAAHAQVVPVPDFSTSDVNPGSRRRGLTSAPLSPRNYLHQVSAWYFGNEG
ncbi:MAG TPA: hypothetical protein VG796_25745 [Verrucomicrobiales bacterium]|nr:hypothetical protein [Verrucomicrobiales bacterium]